MPGREGRSVVGRVGEAALLLVLIAAGARVVYELLAPLLPALLATIVVITLTNWLLLRR